VTTALRHFAVLTERKIIEREYDPVDQRRIFLRLTEEASAEIQRTLLTDDFRDMAIAS
jgi:DNA-binding MarR family transcriptional regulator